MGSNMIHARARYTSTRNAEKLKKCIAAMNHQFPYLILYIYISYYRPYYLGILLTNKHQIPLMTDVVSKGGVYHTSDIGGGLLCSADLRGSIPAGGPEVLD